MTLSLDRSDATVNFTDVTARLEIVLRDITENVEIKSDFTLTHPDYQSIQLPAELSTHFGQLPWHVQHSYLRVKLQQFLQYIYYVSEPREKPEFSDKIENQAIKWSQSKFVQQLSDNNHSDGHFASGWQIIGETEAGFLQVHKDELTLCIRRESHLLDWEQSAQVGDTVSVKMPPRLVEPGYYIAVGTAGSIKDLALQSDNPIVDIYLNVSSQGALVLMNSLTTELNGMAIPFHFKVLYRPEDYIYSDTAIISFAKNDYACLREIIKTIYQNNQDYFQAEIPLFTKYLALGLSIAERPAIDINLAQHRFQIIAEALIEAWQQNRNTQAEKLECIYDRFRQKNINLEYSYINPNSDDIYSVI